MAFVAPKPNSGDFTPPPEGTHMAVCYRLVDLGTQQSTFNNETKRQHKIVISWELADEKMDNGEPFSIHQRYTFSLHEKAKLRADLEGWRGKRFDEAELEAFDLDGLLGKPCLLTVAHTKKADRVFANIMAIAKLPKNMPPPSAPFNRPHSFNLKSPDWALFDAMSVGLQDTIKKSPEYAEARKGGGGGHSEADPPPVDDMDDGRDIPFATPYGIR